jgi:hypothetical protein
MVYFQTKNLRLGIFWRALKNKMLVNVAAIWNFMCPFGNFVVIWNFLCPFGNFVVILYIFTRSGKFFQEKSGNPAVECQVSMFS